MSVVIPAYRGSATIAACLASVRRATAGRRCQIIVVDTSDDDTRAIVATRFPEVELICPAERLSAGRARNLGASCARGGLVFFVDQDCLVPPDWIDKLEPYLADPAVGAIGGSVGIADPRNLSGAAVFFMEFFRHVRSGYPPARTTGFLLGCNLACRADVLSRCAFPDQTIGEDVIFAAAIRAAGYGLMWAPAVEVKHCNRHGWLEFIRYNRAMGRAAAHVHARLHTPRVRPFLKYPALALVAPLGILPLIAWQLARSRWWYLPMFVVLLPLCLLGNLAWAESFRRTATRLRQTRSRGVTCRRSSKDRD